MARNRFWLCFDIAGLGIMGAASIVFAAAIVYSAFHGWEITFSFNKLHEGILEAILFPTGTIMGIITAHRHVRRLP